MKKLIVCLCLGLVVGAVADVVYGYYTDPFSKVISLGEGDRMIFLTTDYDSFQAELTLPDESTIYLSSTKHLNFYYNGWSGSGQSVAERGTITGPCDVRITANSSLHYVSYKIIRPDAVVETGPMNIISLPDDNNGDVDLLVETSTDLQNWTPVYSGSAGTSNSAAFFRTRLIQN